MPVINIERSIMIEKTVRFTSQCFTVCARFGWLDIIGSLIAFGFYRLCFPMYSENFVSASSLAAPNDLSSRSGWRRNMTCLINMLTATIRWDVRFANQIQSNNHRRHPWHTGRRQKRQDDRRPDKTRVSQTRDENIYIVVTRNRGIFPFWKRHSAVFCRVISIESCSA